jgi:cytochrome c oxidase subunit 1
MSSIAHDPAAGHGDAHDHEHAHYPGGIMRWITTTNHKDIGTPLPVVLVHHVHRRRVPGADHRTELFHPGLQIVDPESSIRSPRCMA